MGSPSAHLAVMMSVLKGDSNGDLLPSLICSVGILKPVELPGSPEPYPSSFAAAPGPPDFPAMGWMESLA